MYDPRSSKRGSFIIGISLRNLCVLRASAVKTHR